MLRQTRRDFLHGAALGGAGLLILSDSRSARAYAANEKLDIALVGIGGRGKWYVDVMPKQANLVALCDVDESKAQAAYQDPFVIALMRPMSRADPWLARTRVPVPSRIARPSRSTRGPVTFLELPDRDIDLPVAADHLRLGILRNPLHLEGRLRRGVAHADREDIGRSTMAIHQDVDRDLLVRGFHGHRVLHGGGVEDRGELRDLLVGLGDFCEQLPVPLRLP